MGCYIREVEETMTIDASKYVVLDLETNGISVNDDILSISLYRPDDGQLFHRYMPLERASNVKTTRINGITKEDVEGTTALTPREIWELRQKFELDKRTILIYSGFDEKMLKHYFRRHGLGGFSKFRFYNFKQDIISSRFSEGNITKDNLCRLFGIANVTEVHSAANDCILQWQLFEKMNGKKLLVTNNKVFELSGEYFIPASFFYSHPNLRRVRKNVPSICIEQQLVKSFKILGYGIQRFDNNVNGILIEHLINSMIDATKLNSIDFCIENKSKLTFLGNLPSKIEEIHIVLKEDGTVKAASEEAVEIVKQYNAVLDNLRRQMTPLITYISQEVMKGEEIYSQELVVNNNCRVLALCDLSSRSAVLEIKSYYSPDLYVYREQLYFEANGRECYFLQVNWAEMPQAFEIQIYKVMLSIGEQFERKPKKESSIGKAKAQIETDSIELLEYVNQKYSVRLKCKICEHEWEASYYRATKGARCPFCKLQQEKVERQISDEQKKKLRAASYLARVYERSGGKLLVKDYKGSRELVSVQCNECGYSWEARADHLLERLRCPECRG